jgi:hypothetical protein
LFRLPPLRHPVNPLCNTALHSIPPSFLCIDPLFRLPPTIIRACRYAIQSNLCVLPRFIRYLRLFFASTPCSVYLRPLYVLAVTPSSQTSVYYRASFDTSVFSLHRPLVPFTSDHYTCLPLRHPVKPLCTTALHSIPPSFLCIDRHVNSCTRPPRPFCPPMVSQRVVQCFECFSNIASLSAPTSSISVMATAIPCFCVLGPLRPPVNTLCTTALHPTPPCLSLCANVVDFCDSDGNPLLLLTWPITPSSQHSVYYRSSFDVSVSLSLHQRRRFL